MGKLSWYTAFRLLLWASDNGIIQNERYIHCRANRFHNVINHWHQGPEKMGVDFQLVSFYFTNQLYHMGKMQLNNSNEIYVWIDLNYYILTKQFQNINTRNTLFEKGAILEIGMWYCIFGYIFVCLVYMLIVPVSYYSLKDHKRNFKMNTNFLSIVVSQVENKCGLNFINQSFLGYCSVKENKNT